AVVLAAAEPAVDAEVRLAQHKRVRAPREQRERRVGRADLLAPPEHARRARPLEVAAVVEQRRPRAERAVEVDPEAGVEVPEERLADQLVPKRVGAVLRHLYRDGLGGGAEGVGAERDGLGPG